MLRGPAPIALALVDIPPEPVVEALETPLEMAAPTAPARSAPTPGAASPWDTRLIAASRSSAKRPSVPISPAVAAAATAAAAGPVAGLVAEALVAGALAVEGSAQRSQTTREVPCCCSASETVRSCSGVARKGVKRKLSTPVAASTPEFVVPRVSVRHGGYVVPRYRARPHGTERKLLGMANMSELRVAPSPAGKDELESEEGEVESPTSSHKRILRDDSSISISPAVHVHACQDIVSSRKRVTFAESVSESSSASARERVSK